MKLPLSQEELENFVMNHVYEWSKEYIELNLSDNHKLSDVMEHEFNTLMQDFAVKFRDTQRELFKEYE